MLDAGWRIEVCHLASSIQHPASLSPHLPFPAANGCGLLRGLFPLPVLMSRPDPAPSPAEAAAPDSFESALERLESIVSRMEGERLPLEELLACYEQGTRLLKSCGDYLQAAEQRIELIAKDEDGQPRTTDFSTIAATVATPAEPENRPGDAPQPNPKS